MAARLIRSLWLAVVLTAAACSAQSTPDNTVSATSVPVTGIAVDQSEPASIYDAYAAQATDALDTAFGWDLTVQANLDRRSLVVDFVRLREDDVNLAMVAATTGTLGRLGDDLNRLLDDAGHDAFMLSHVIVQSPEGIWPCEIAELRPPYECIAEPSSGGDPRPLPPIVD